MTGIATEGAFDNELEQLQNQLIAPRTETNTSIDPPEHHQQQQQHESTKLLPMRGETRTSNVWFFYSEEILSDTYVSKNNKEYQNCRVLCKVKGCTMSTTHKIMGHHFSTGNLNRHLQSAHGIYAKYFDEEKDDLVQILTVNTKYHNNILFLPRVELDQEVTEPPAPKNKKGKEKTSKGKAKFGLTQLQRNVKVGEHNPTTNTTTTTSNGNDKVDAEQVEQALELLILEKNLPLSAVESERFRQILKLLNAPEQLSTLHSRKIESHYYTNVKELEKIIKDRVRHADTVSLTLDLWTSLNDESYLAIFFHINDEEFKHSEVCAHFDRVDGLLNGVRLGKVVYSVLEKFGATTKLLHIVTDGLEDKDTLTKHLNTYIREERNMIKQNNLENPLISDEHYSTPSDLFSSESKQRELKCTTNLLNLAAHKFISTFDSTYDATGMFQQHYLNGQEEGASISNSNAGTLPSHTAELTSILKIQELLRAFKHTNDLRWLLKKVTGESLSGETPLASPRDGYESLYAMLNFYLTNASIIEKLRAESLFHHNRSKYSEFTDLLQKYNDMFAKTRLYPGEFDNLTLFTKIVSLFHQIGHIQKSNDKTGVSEMYFDNFVTLKTSLRDLVDGLTDQDVIDMGFSAESLQHEGDLWYLPMPARNCLSIVLDYLEQHLTLTNQGYLGYLFVLLDPTKSIEYLHADMSPQSAGEVSSVIKEYICDLFGSIVTAESLSLGYRSSSGNVSTIVDSSNQVNKAPTASQQIPEPGNTSGTNRFLQRKRMKIHGHDTPGTPPPTTTQTQTQTTKESLSNLSPETLEILRLQIAKEYDSFVNSARLPPSEYKFDNLSEFWKTQQEWYPSLTRVMRSLLAVPNSSIDQKKADETGEYITELRKQGLKPSTLANMVVLKLNKEVVGDRVYYRVPQL